MLILICQPCCAKHADRLIENERSVLGGKIGRRYTDAFPGYILHENRPPDPPSPKKLMSADPYGLTSFPN